jgi:hypothetical protein
MIESPPRPCSRLRLAIAFAAAHAATACGFGTYDDTAAPPATTSTSGVADAGMWWPWACPDGTNPSPASAEVHFSAAGTCGPGGAFSIGVDGCLLSGNFGALGLAEVDTVTHSGKPQLGGWAVRGTSLADGTSALHCEASVRGASGAINFACTHAEPASAFCQSTLTPVAP